MNTSKLFTLNLTDLAKGLVVAVFAAIITYLAGLIGVPGFDFSQINIHSLELISFIAGVSYLAKNFISDSTGKILGHIG